MPDNTILRFFQYEHLTNDYLKDTSKLFADLAHKIDKGLKPSPEKAVALRKLLESKDAAVRCVVEQLEDDGQL